MSDRIFPEVSIPYGDKSTKAMQITCACCGAVAYFPHQTGINRKPPIAATQHFQNKGWVVGSNPRKDFCPIHAAPAKRKGQKAMVDRVATIADKPREMSREDRRIINDKLDEVYAKDAYKSPGRILPWRRIWACRVIGWRKSATSSSARQAQTRFMTSS
ncbi:hypothetical protein [Rhizobium oryzihabitans]|uniref:hypothetical protein n=1 Tax=Rhizobium oryzihabitans TaxID=2267833 RepID=UPI001FE919F9|nr:hypothetical protein [Rhizobium oryzihabitans]